VQAHACKRVPIPDLVVGQIRAALSAASLPSLRSCTLCSRRCGYASPVGPEPSVKYSATFTCRFDDPHAAVRENDTYGGRRQSRWISETPAALLFAARSTRAAGSGGAGHDRPDALLGNRRQPLMVLCRTRRENNAADQKRDYDGQKDPQFHPVRHGALRRLTAIAAYGRPGDKQSLLKCLSYQCAASTRLTVAPVGRRSGYGLQPPQDGGSASAACREGGGRPPERPMPRGRRTPNRRLAARHFRFSRSVQAERYIRLDHVPPV
jgi:hypothetical protein